MEDPSNIQKLLEEHMGYRKTREQCYYRFYCWHAQVQAMRNLKSILKVHSHDLLEYKDITEGKYDEVRKLLVTEIEWRTNKLCDFQSRWSDSILIMEKWEADFWENAWRKFHNIPEVPGSTSNVSSLSNTVETTEEDEGPPKRKQSTRDIGKGQKTINKQQAKEDRKQEELHSKSFPNTSYSVRNRTTAN